MSLARAVFGALLLATLVIAGRRPQRLLPQTDDEMRAALFHSDGVSVFFEAIRHRDLRRRTFEALNTPATPGRECLAHLRNASNGYADPCGLHGRCVDNACQCDDDAVKGHWVGTLCTECARGWAGRDCTAECAGGSCNRCSSHGTCNEGTQGDGSCTCYGTRTTGYWGGRNCSQCAENYFGATCEQACPGIELTGTACFGRGVCITTLSGGGTCRCDPGFGSASGCFECDAAHWGTECRYRCDGYDATSGLPCSGHGRCVNGTQGTGKCICDPTWGTSDCSRQCPNATCNYGTCLDGADRSAECRCIGNFAPPDCSTCIANMTGSTCELKCLGDPICSKHGTCVWELSGTVETSKCECTNGYYGRACAEACPGDPPCGGHGKCSNSFFSCECDEGFTGETCNSCAPGYEGVECKKKCPSSPISNKTCNDQGDCFDGVCYCRVTSGYEFCGAACDNKYYNSTTASYECPTGLPEVSKCPFAGRYGPVCSKECPGTLSGRHVCSGHGFCDDGTTGTGKCTCMRGYGTTSCALQCPSSPLGVCSGPGRGYCATTDVSISNPEGSATCVCYPAFGGPSCNQTCPTVAGKICAGHGTCDRHGLAKCNCDLEWTGPDCDVPCGCNLRNGRCNATLCASLRSWETCTACDCAPGFIGTCESCAEGRQGANCQGVCSENGVTTGTECICSPFWSGPACDVQCERYNNSICGGRGTCRWGNRNDGGCDCNATYYGPGCSTICTPDMCRTRSDSPLLHPQCNPNTGECECQDNVRGHWDGPTCSICHPRYWGPTCTEECQCNDHGVCDQNTGECSCYNDDERGHYSGTYCEQCADGFIGQRCSRQNIEITRVNRFRAASEPLDSPDGEPVWPSVLTLSADGTTVFAGSSTVYRYNASSADFNMTAKILSSDPACPQTVVRVFLGSLYAYLALQPDRCNRLARLARVPLASLTPTGNASVATIDVLGLETSDLTNTETIGAAAQIRAIDGIDSSGYPVVVYALSEPQRDPLSGVTTYSGGVLGRVRTVLLWTEGRAAAFFEQPISADFTVRALVAAEVVIRSTPTEVETDQQMLVAGDRLVNNAYTWSIMYLRLSVSGFENAIAGQYVEDMIECWPMSTEDGSLEVSTRCASCVSVDALQFYEGSFIASMYTSSTARNVTAFIRFVPFARVADRQLLYARFPSDPDTCVAARYSAQTSTIDLAANPAVKDGIVPDVFVHMAVNDDLNTRGTALAVDVPGGSAFIALSPVAAGSVPSRITKLSVTPDELLLAGTKLLTLVEMGGSSNETVPERVSMMTASPAARLLYGLIGGINYVRLATFLLYETRSVEPDLADRRPGTRVTIRGSGFTSSVAGTRFDVMCRFGTEEVPAIPGTVGFDSIQCVAPDVQDGAAALACRGEQVAISLYGAETQWFTTNDVRLKRVEAPRVEPTVTPSFGGRAGGTQIWISGTGFVASPFAKCLFWSPSPRSYERVNSSFVAVRSNRGYCIQPETVNASVPPSYINITLDGQLYAPFGPARYEIVGSAESLAVNSTITRAASAITTLDIELQVIDSERHALGSLDARQRIVCIERNTTADECDPALFAWRTSDDGYPWPPCRNNTIFAEERCLPTTNGTVVFRNVTLREPRVGRVIMVFSTVDSGGAEPWHVQTELVITQGEAHALALQNANALRDKPIVNGRALSPSPEVVVIDPLGNILQELTFEITVHGRSFYTVFDVFSDNSNKTFQGPTTVPIVSERRNLFRFDAVFLKYVHGAEHFVEFSSTPALLPTITPPLRTQQCDNAAVAYKVAKTELCAPCPPVGAICNGSEFIEVLPGYWRGNTSTEIYPCPGGPAVCPGSQAARNAPCAEGYAGPLCALCAEGYGRSGPTACSQCGSFVSSVVIVVFGVLFFLTVLLVWTTITLRAGAVTDVTVIFRTVVNHMQATGKLGEFSQQWGPLVKSLFSVQDSASSPSVAGVSAIDCVLRATDNDYRVVFYAYMSLPVVSGLMAVLVFAVVRILKLKPVLSDEVDHEVEQDIKSMGANARTAILRLRYPFYMVVTTTLCVNMFAMYQTLITQSTTVLACETVIVGPGDERSFVKVDMSISCEKGTHVMSTAALLFAVGYGFGIPAAFIFGYIFVNSRLGRPALTRMMFLFLIGGYRDKFWWWQAIIMVRKMLLVLIVVFINDAELQTFTGMWIMGLALIGQMWFKPNTKPSFHRVETLSLALITLTLNLGLLYFWPEMSDTGRAAITIVLIVLTAAAIVMFAVFLFNPMRQTVLDAIKNARSMAASVRQVVAESTSKEPQRVFRARTLGYDERLSDDEELEQLSAPSGARVRVRVDASRPQAPLQQPLFEEVDAPEIYTADARKPLTQQQIDDL